MKTESMSMKPGNLVSSVLTGLKIAFEWTCGDVVEYECIKKTPKRPNIKRL